MNSSFFTSPLFYGIYIILMLCFFVWLLYKYLFPYQHAKKDSEKIKLILEKLKEEENILLAAKKFEEWVNNSNQSAFIKNFVKPSFISFSGKLMENQKKGILLTPDIYDYFLEDTLMQRFGRRKLIEAVPGFFLAIGIIGTFLGIAVGVSNLNPGGNAEIMKIGISTLLSGMKVKFLSSICGIALSVIWQILDKMIFYPKLSETFFEVRDQMDEIFPTQEQSTVLFQMLSNQEKHLVDFQSFISEMMIPQMVTGMTEAISQTIAPQMEQTQSMMKDMLDNNRESQLEGIGIMVDKFVGSLSEITGDHMKHLGEALSKTIEWQEKVHSEMSILVQSMQDSSKEQSIMAEKSTELIKEIHGYTDKIINYQSIMENNIALLNATLERNNILHDNISNLLDSTVKEREIFIKQSDHLNNHLQSFNDLTGKQLDINVKLENNLLKLDSNYEAQQLLSENFLKYLELANNSNQELSTIVDELNENGNIQSTLQKALNASLDLILKEKTDVGNMVTELNGQLVTQIADIDLRIKHLSEVWRSTSDTFTSVNKHLGTSMNQFSEDMHRGLEHTFNQFDDELSKSVNYCDRQVECYNFR
ncbi:hypothetical protein MXL46_07740 [Heyndrickxia sporothermodurans]|uniref:hypothetical protein n=1 Tax=Heyndrickxia sporothermodurans TaxID=46224 RepID=UPI002DBC235C|nr:hypothetical protein [Heyndrickxia sporothermodurans]MEB6548987.1 hypothetical protein [Heyndrickxia sporothermodurans]